MSMNVWDCYEIDRVTLRDDSNRSHTFRVCVRCAALVPEGRAWDHAIVCQQAGRLEMRALQEDPEFAGSGGRVVRTLVGVFVCDQYKLPHVAIGGEPVRCPDCRQTEL